MFGWWKKKQRPSFTYVRHTEPFNVGRICTQLITKSGKMYYLTLIGHSIDGTTHWLRGQCTTAKELLTFTLQERTFDGNRNTFTTDDGTTLYSDCIESYRITEESEHFVERSYYVEQIQTNE